MGFDTSLHYLRNK